jgi:hypothetical protein
MDSVTLAALGVGVVAQIARMVQQIMSDAAAGVITNNQAADRLVMAQHHFDRAKEGYEAAPAPKPEGGA